MNLFYLWAGITEIFISFIGVLIIFLLSFKIFSLLTKKIDDLKEIKANNISVSIAAGSFLFGIMILVSNAVNASIDTVMISADSNSINMQMIGSNILHILIYFAVSAVFSFIVLWIAIMFFMKLTGSIDEWEEIKKDNISVSILLASLIVILSVFLSSPLSTILDGLIPVPEMKIAGVKIAKTFINPDVLIKGGIELIITLPLIIIIFFISVKAFSLTTKSIDEIGEIKKNNISVALLLSSFIGSLMILSSSAINPVNDKIQLVLKKGNIKLMPVLILIAEILIIYIGTLIFSFILLQLIMRIFMMFTSKINEIEEVKKKNTAAAIFLCVFLICSSIILRHGIELLLNAWVNMPKVEPGIF